MSPSPNYLTFSPDIAIDPTTKLPTGFSGIAYSGGVVPDYGWLGDVAIDIATVQVPDRMFALVNHDPDQRAGHCRVWIENHAIHVAGEFSKTTEEGRSVAGEFAENAPWKLSVGFNGPADRYEPPTEQTLNGQTLTLSTVFRNARILEVSFVPADADPNTRVEAFGATPGVPPMPDDSPDLKAQIAELKGQVEALTARATTAETALADERKSTRLAAVKALFAAIDREWDEAKAAPYLEMSAVAFEAVSADLRARPAPDPTLFQATATSGKSQTPVVELSAQKIYAARRL